MNKSNLIYQYTKLLNFYITLLNAFNQLVNCNNKKVKCNIHFTQVFSKNAMRQMYYLFSKNVNCEMSNIVIAKILILLFLK